MEGLQCLTIPGLGGVRKGPEKKNRNLAVYNEQFLPVQWSQPKQP